VQAPPLVVWPLMALAGMLIGAVWIGIVGWLREKREVNETIASLLMSFIAIALFNQAVETVLRDPASLNKPSTHALAEGLRIGGIGEIDIADHRQRQRRADRRILVRLEQVFRRLIGLFVFTYAGLFYVKWSEKAAFYHDFNFTHRSNGFAVCM
jgi:ABC-type uncharacterized transport system permease subunit